MSGTDVPPISVSRAIEKFILESGPGQYNVERHGRREVHEGDDPGAPNEVRVTHAKREAGRLHVAHKGFGRLWAEGERDVDVGAQAGNAVRRDGLGVGAEDIPAAQRARTGDSAARSSTAAGCTGTTEEIGQADVRQQILVSVRRAGPGRVQREHLASEFLGDTKLLDRAETRDALTPVRILALARCIPISVRQFPNRSRDHNGIVARL